MPSFEAKELVRGMAPLLAGAGAAQLVSFAALPLLTRLYTPADFGALAFFGAGALLAGLWICGRYELAVPIPREDDEARGILSLATMLGIAAALLSVPVSFLVRDLLLHFARFRDVAPWVVWIPPSLLLTSLYQPLSYWFTRKARFRAIAATRAVQSSAAAGAQITFGALGALGPAGLIAGALAGQAAATLGLEIAARSDAPLTSRLGGTRSGLRALASRYRAFPLFTTPAGLLQLAADQVPLLLVPALFGVAVAGAYALPARLLQALVLLVAAPAAQVFYPLAARREGADLADAARRVQRMLLDWTVTPSLVVAVTADSLFATAFGEDWRTSGGYFLLLLPWFITAVPFAPLSQLLLVLERQRDALHVHLGVLAASLVGLLAFAPSGNPGLAVLAFSGFGAAARLVSLEFVMRACGARKGEAIAALGGAALRAVPYLLVAFAAHRFLPGSRPAVAVAIGLIAVHVVLQFRNAHRGDAGS